MAIPGTQGFIALSATVEEINGPLAVIIDQFGKRRYMRTDLTMSGQLPQVGETWVIKRESGFWAFQIMLAPAPTVPDVVGDLPDLAVQHVSLGRKGNDNHDGSEDAPKATIEAAKAALPLGAFEQHVGKIICGYGTYDLGADDVVGLELGYGGFTLEGIGVGLTNFVYSGTGTAMRFENYAVAQQKLRPVLKSFTLTAPNARIGLDLRGSTYGLYDSIEVVGASNKAAIVPNGVGILFDGSYGPLIGCWWNKLFNEWRVSGWDTNVKLTGIPTLGQANENKILEGRCNLYTRCGIDADCGDDILIEGVDCTTGVAGLVPTVAAVRLNGLACKANQLRFENIGAGGICILFDGVQPKVADRCSARGNVFATEAGSIAYQANLGSSFNMVDPVEMISKSPAVIPYVDHSHRGLIILSPTAGGTFYG